jgi:hypothetical protein
MLTLGMTLPPREEPQGLVGLEVIMNRVLKKIE